MPKFQVILYDLPNGNCPIEDFIDSLDLKMQAKVLRTIAILQENVY